MFCPQCRAEYRPGFTRCPVCELYLVDQLPEVRPAPDPDRKLVPVFRTTDPVLLPIVKSLLDSAGIEYFVQGEEALSLLPLGPPGKRVHRSAWAAVIHVPEADAPGVEEMLAQLDADFEF